MTNTDLLSPWVRRFLLEYLVVERNLARNTQKSYRDTLQQFLPFVARSAHRRLDRLQVGDLTLTRTRAFLQHMEVSRGCGITTRNQRLAAIRSLARLLACMAQNTSTGAGSFRPSSRRKSRSVGWLFGKRRVGRVAERT